MPTDDGLINVLQLGEALEKRLIQLEDKLEDQIGKIVDLSHIGAVFTSIFDLDQVLPMLAETALNILKGEVAEIVLFAEDGIKKSISWGLTSEVTGKLTAPTGENVYGYVRRTGESLILEESTLKDIRSREDLKANVSSFIAAPLKTQGKVIGAIAIANKVDQSPFDGEDRFALEMLGSFAAVAVMNSDLHQQALEKQKMEHELSLAEYVQKRLMADRTKIMDGLAVYAYNAQAAQVGGDFFDIMEIDKGRYLAVVADVSDKGVPAALIMASVRAYIRLAAEKLTSLASLAAKINDLMCRDVEKLENVFVTMFFALVDTQQRSLTVVNAGHPPAFLVRREETIEFWPTGPILGQFVDSQYNEQTTHLRPSDRIFVFTDGIYECVNARGEMLGLGNAKVFFQKNRNLPWPLFLERLQVLLQEYSYDQGRVDDTTLMMIEVT